MNLQTFKNLLLSLLESGVTISRVDPEDESVNVWYDLHTGARSYLHICYTEGLCLYVSEGNKHGIINTFDDVVLLAKNCLLGREYCEPGWETLFNKELEAV